MTEGILKRMVTGEITIGKEDAFTFIDGNFDFVDPKGALFVEGIANEVSVDTFISNSLGLIELPFGYRACSSDCHPPGHREHIVIAPHCVIGTPGQEYHPKLRWIYEKSSERLIKGMNLAVLSYSIMSSPQFSDHISNLVIRGIKRVFIAGLAFNYCVLEAAIAYAVQRFETYIIRDATRSVPHQDGNEEEYIEHRIQGRDIRLVNTHQLV